MLELLKVQWITLEEEVTSNLDLLLPQVKAPKSLLADFKILIFIKIIYIEAEVILNRNNFESHNEKKCLI